jgi:hypothetical protein
MWTQVQQALLSWCFLVPFCAATSACSGIIKVCVASSGMMKGIVASEVGAVKKGSCWAVEFGCLTYGTQQCKKYVLGASALHPPSYEWHVVGLSKPTCPCSLWVGL